ncbi:MAG: hypothetical protein JWM38_1819 [Sphingomonas bacterium]|nr:hypothetical protein [Sphingomonas bacterium]MDB5718392.1 hypothetical protein [Sphingomonas bacterium]
MADNDFPAVVSAKTGSPRVRSKDVGKRRRPTTPLDPDAERLNVAPETEDDADGKSAERTCILSGAKGAREDLVRLVVGPDGMVSPDVRARAGGRGAWIGVDRIALEKALAKGKLKGALARVLKTAAFTIPDDLPDRIATALERAALDRIGLEARAGALVTGSDRIADAARKGTVRMLLHAQDAGGDGLRKLDQAWRVGGGEARGLVIPATRAILSMALGRENVVHIALIAPAAAARVSHALGRWRSFIGRDDAAVPCESQSPGSSAHEQSSEGSGLPDER